MAARPFLPFTVSVPATSMYFAGVGVIVNVLPIFFDQAAGMGAQVPRALSSMMRRSVHSCCSDESLTFAPLSSTSGESFRMGQISRVQPSFDFGPPSIPPTMLFVGPEHDDATVARIGAAPTTI